jgi:P-type Cu+ transporter
MLCKAAVAAKLKQIQGVISYDVDLKTDSVTILYDPAKVTIEMLRNAITQAGFQAKEIEDLAK